MTLEKVSTEDLKAFRDGRLQDVSTEGLKAIRGSAPTSNQKQESLLPTIIEQAAQGASFNLSDEPIDAAQAIMRSIGPQETFKEAFESERQETAARQQRQREQHPIASTLSNIAGAGATGVGGATTKAGQAFIKGLASGGLKKRMFKSSLSGASGVGLAGYGAEQGEERKAGAKTGAIVGGTIAGAIPAVGVGAKGVYNYAVPQIDEAIAPLAKRARELGIPLRSDQVAPSRARANIQKISQEIPLSGAEKFEDVQRKAFTKAVAKTIGQDSEDLGPETIKRFRRDNKSLFDSVLKDKTFQIDKDDFDNIALLKSEIDDTLGITDRDARILQKEIDGILSDMRAGELSGDKIANIRSNVLKKATNAKGGTGIYGQVIDKLDNIIKKSSTPEEAEAIDLARRQWRNFKTLKRLLEKSTEGTIKPTDLINQVSSNRFIDASDKAVGEDDLIDLARIGKQFLPKLGGSDTTQKAAYVLGGGGVGSGVTTAIITGNPVAAAVPLGIAGSVMGANRALQGLSTNQKLIDKAIRSSQLSGLIE